MENKKYSSIIYFITAVIAMTLAAQVYWNYKNYQAGKEQLIRDVQLSLDLAVDTYYEDLATRNTIGLFSNSKGDTKNFFKSQRFKNLLKSRTDSTYLNVDTVIVDDHLDSLGFVTIEGASPAKIDSIINSRKFKPDSLIDKRFSTPANHRLISPDDENQQPSSFIQDFLEVQRLKKDTTAVYDTLANGELRLKDRQSALEALTTKIVVSFNDDEVDIKKLDTLVMRQLRNIGIDRGAHSLSYSPKGDTIQRPAIPGLPKSMNPTYDLYVFSNSKLLPPESILSVGFNDITSIILKRNLFGILLSFLLIAVIIGILFYLLKIIQEQKQLAEIKNDFISNITHEFKTPIATIGVAMESIQFFNDANDVEKTKKYVDMSSQQVAKLNTMVEKLLETATLDSEVLMLNKQETNIAELLTHISQSHQETLNGKALSLDLTNEDIQISVDLFHLENALDNIIDNAIKYGGNHITVKLYKSTSGVHIDITDGGNHLTKTQTHQIFEKFYRVPKGNTHDVKGFGIGLYYTKTIIEKHAGTITVQTQPTIFKITLPYV